MKSVTNTRLHPGLIILMSLATGISVASNYYVQPLLHTIAAYFRITNSTAGLIVTSAQIAFALGLMLLVPLADLIERKKLIVVMTLLAGAGMLVTAAAPSIIFVFIGTTVTGMFSVVAQILVPYAATLAQPEERGKIVGHMMSGLLLGILLARTVSGYCSTWFGWQSIYWLGAGMMFITGAVLGRNLPRYHSSIKISYPSLLKSTLTLFIDERVLRIRALLGAIIFCIFSILWTSISFLLANAPFNYSDGTIGLFGLVGAAGALAASRVGKLIDSGKTNLVTSLCIGLLLFSWFPLAVSKSSLLALIIGILLLDLAVQALHITNLSVLNHLSAESRNRLTSGYMTCYFAGGACGSVLSTVLFDYAGWLAVSLCGVTLSLVGVIVWWLSQRDNSSSTSTPAQGHHK
ncbi:MFS transporter [Solimicrobium silvestre]|uniref:Major Facilitator Superfamily n=1 Tax=Solimicrobium silvestre TaxID=2099400 RepID=A0A2S9GVN9_9BURK|nr:MFS transporter [Solimicrobium silvestre]PRC91789.1 Major Facilitator Superfamily [Solimicrobium silvestre]